jgi:hypothetical protein
MSDNNKFEHFNPKNVFDGIIEHPNLKLPEFDDAKKIMTDWIFIFDTDTVTDKEINQLNETVNKYIKLNKNEKVKLSDGSTVDFVNENVIIDLIKKFSLIIKETKTLDDIESMSSKLKLLSIFIYISDLLKQQKESDVLNMTTNLILQTYANTPASKTATPKQQASVSQTGTPKQQASVSQTGTQSSVSQTGAKLNYMKNIENNLRGLLKALYGIMDEYIPLFFKVDNLTDPDQKEKILQAGDLRKRYEKIMEEIEINDKKRIKINRSDQQYIDFDKIDSNIDIMITDAWNISMYIDEGIFYTK